MYLVPQQEADIATLMGILYNTLIVHVHDMFDSFIGYTKLCKIIELSA